MESSDSSAKDLLSENIKNLLRDYKFTIESLAKITQLDYTWLKDYVDGKNNKNDLPMIEGISLSRMSFMLLEGVKSTNDDDRVKCVIDILVDEFEIKFETLAIYAELNLEEIENFMNDTNSISYEKRYKLAVASLFLHYLFKKTL